MKQNIQHPEHHHSLSELMIKTLPGGWTNNYIICLYFSVIYFLFIVDLKGCLWIWWVGTQFSWGILCGAKGLGNIVDKIQSLENANYFPNFM